MEIGLNVAILNHITGRFYPNEYRGGNLPVMLYDTLSCFRLADFLPKFLPKISKLKVSEQFA